MGSVFGRFFRATTFGESHGPAVGVIVDGAPSGIAIDRQSIQDQLDRRRPGVSKYVTSRKEPDEVEILSGIAQGKTLGTPIALLVRNKNAQSKDYESIKELFRPGHADFTYYKKYGFPPQPGGGRSSGRETVGRVAAGAIAKAFINRFGISAQAYTVAVGGVHAVTIDPDYAEKNPLRCADPGRFQEMATLVDEARQAGDSVGGIVEILIQGVPAGLGDPVFDKLDALLGGALLSIGAVKGVEFGAGFQLAELKGSEANDPISAAGFVSNNAGGVLGGISNGEPIVVRLAVKPTSSIAVPQRTIDLWGKERTIQVKGRHDPCLCPRICPVAESMASLVLADAILEQQAMKGRMDENTGA